MAQRCVRAIAQEQARGRIGQQARPHRLERAAQRQSVRYPSRGGGDLAAAVSTKFAIEDLHGTDRQTRPESGDPNGCLAASPLMRSKVRAYSHQGHGPRADRQAGYISATFDTTPSLANGSRSIHQGRLPSTCIFEKSAAVGWKAAVAWRVRRRDAPKT